MAISSNLTSGFDFRLHSLSRGGTFENLKFEKSGGDTFMATLKLEKIENISDIVFLVCDVSSIDLYLSEIAKDRKGRVTHVYLLQNGLLDISHRIKSFGLRLRRISIGGVSLHLEGHQLSCTGRFKPILEIAIEGSEASGMHKNIVLKALESVGDVVLMKRECEVIWNKLVRSGPHFLDTLLNLDSSIKMGLHERLELSRRLFAEYQGVATSACGFKLAKRSESLRLLESLVSNSVVNSGAKRFLNNKSNEEYEALVGRVKDFALTHGVDVSTLLLVEQLTSKR